MHAASAISLGKEQMQLQPFDNINEIRKKHILQKKDTKLLNEENS
jgi:hypothetical protein